MQFRKLFYSIFYTKPSQLRSRLWLTVKRKFSESCAAYRNRRFENRQIRFAFDDTLPGPLFDARTGFFKHTGGPQKQFSLTFLNHTRAFSPPVNWHDEQLEKGTRLWKLNLHYMEYLEEVNDEWFMLLINDWISQNKPYKRGYYLDSWNAYALSIRVVVWMQQLAVRKDQLDEHFVDRVCRSVYKQLLFLEKNIERDIRGNHIIKNVKALLWGSRFFKRDECVERWQKKGMKLLRRELGEQILFDGMHFERSPVYHNQVLADFMECYAVLPDSPLKKQLSDILPKMVRVSRWLAQPDGMPALFNDGGPHMAYRADEIERQWQAKPVFSEHPEESSVKDFEKAIILPEAGYYGFRDSENYILCDAGKVAPDYLPAHGHGDIFSFIWTIGGRRIFIDKGVYEYNAGGRREASRSTLSHNTVTIAGKDQCEFWDSFRMAKRANVSIIEKRFSEQGFQLRARHDGYKRLKGKPVHERTFTFDRGTLQIVDVIEGGDNQVAEARFLLHPGISVTEENGALLLINGDVELRFSSSGVAEVTDSVWYTDFGIEEHCKQIVVRLDTIPMRAIHKIARAG